MTEGTKMHDPTNKREIIIYSGEKIAEMANGQKIQVKSLNEHDHEGHCWLWMELVNGEEFISYDDGLTWEEPDYNGYW